MPSSSPTEQKPMLIRTVAIGIAATLAIGFAAAQSRPYNVKSFGMYRAVIMQGDFSAKTSLAAVLAERPTTGVGAVSEARGEITIYDGKLIVSYGRPAANPPADAEHAALLAVSTAPGWQNIPVDHDVAAEDIESFLAQTAATHGLDPEGPFPFQIRGTLGPYSMHVNAAPTNGPHGMGQPAAITVERKGDSIAGSVAGIYASRDLVGIVCHGGTRTHSHWIAADGAATAHLDAWGLKAGSLLSLPKP
jgi:Alpha-acetolactate decarboxylase